MVSTQEWLDKTYPLETRHEITKLEIVANVNKYDRNVKLIGFINLKTLNCYYHKLHDINDCVNLEDLKLGIDNDYCWDFVSLELLKNLTKLKNLYIYVPNRNSFTNIDPIIGGWEYLPDSLENVDVECYEKSYVFSSYYVNFQDWKKAQTYLIKQVKEEENAELYVRIKNLEETIATWENKFQRILSVEEKLTKINTKLEKDLAKKEITIKSLQKELFPLKLDKIRSEQQQLLDECFSLLKEKEQEKLTKLMGVVKKTIQERKESDFFAKELIEERKEYFQDKLESRIIDKLCQLQEEIIKLESQIYIGEELEARVEVPIKL